MVTPARRREPRSGKRRSGKCKPLPVKGNKERKAEKPRLAFSSSSSSVFSVTSDVSYYNEGAISSSKAKDGDVRNNDDQTVIIQDSLPLADSFKVCRRNIFYSIKSSSSQIFHMPGFFECIVPRWFSGYVWEKFQEPKNIHGKVTLFFKRQ